MPNLEEAIRERAYHLWIADGQPEGKADIYWLNAQHEILTISVESSASITAAADTDETYQKGKGRAVGKNQNSRCLVHASGVAQDRTTSLCAQHPMKLPLQVQ